jgi:hypothetical protein
MSKNLIINTPLPIMVGKSTFSFLTFEDLYAKCLKDPALFSEMAEAPDNLTVVLAGRKIVLSARCARKLIELLKNRNLRALAQKYLEQGIPWPSGEVTFWGNPRSRTFRATCTWPNCPSD